MTLSLGEVQSLSLKAARGAGWDWAEAAEIGRALRWLVAAGCTDGPALLSAHLSEAPSGEVCALRAGLSLADFAHDPTRWQVAGAVPAQLLLPFVAIAARQRKEVLTLVSAGGVATTDGEGIAGAIGGAADRVTSGGRFGTPWPRATRADLPGPVLDHLNRLAHRTYAPATEASRQSGAGAGLTDND